MTATWYQVSVVWYMYHSAQLSSSSSTVCIELPQSVRIETSVTLLDLLSTGFISTLSPEYDVANRGNGWQSASLGHGIIEQSISSECHSTHCWDEPTIQEISKTNHLLNVSLSLDWKRGDERLSWERLFMIEEVGVRNILREIYLFIVSTY